MLGGSVIFFDDVHQPNVAGSVGGDGKADGIRGAIPGEAVATATGVAAVAQLALTGFRRFDDFGRMGVASTRVRVA
jgi:hypothetical protein